jgi:hypothetical protein
MNGRWLCTLHHSDPPRHGRASRLGPAQAGEKPGNSCHFFPGRVCDRIQSRAVQPWPPGPRRFDRARRALSNHLSATFWLEDVRFCIRSQGADLAQRRRPSPSIRQSSHRARDLRTSMEPFILPAFEATCVRSPTILAARSAMPHLPSGCRLVRARSVLCS